jgi:hypothetical protein
VLDPQVQSLRQRDEKLIKSWSEHKNRPTYWWFRPQITDVNSCFAILPRSRAPIFEKFI